MPTTKTTTSTTRRRRKPSTKKAPQPPTIPSYSVAAVRGIQSGREYYALMMPLRMLAKSFLSTVEEMPAAMRSQRLPNPRRVKQIARYINENPKTYVFSSITASVTFPVEADETAFCFESLGDSDAGRLQIPLSAQFLINDGQHRIGGLKAALHENPELGDETISVVVFLDLGLKRQQQIFHDLNHYASKPTKSLNLLYDHRSEYAEVVRALMNSIPVFARLTDTEKTSVGSKSSKLFTLNGLHSAVEIMRKGLGEQFTPQLLQDYWNAVALQMNDWQAVMERKASAGEVRQETICGHAICLEALAYVALELLHDSPTRLNWQVRLDELNLDAVNWRKTNPVWEGLFIFGGSIRKNRTTARAFGQYLCELSQGKAAKGDQS